MRTQQTREWEAGERAREKGKLLVVARGVAGAVVPHLTRLNCAANRMQVETRY